jgi:hypothetical protein
MYKTVTPQVFMFNDDNVFRGTFMFAQSKGHQLYLHFRTKISWYQPANPRPWYRNWTLLDVTRKSAMVWSKCICTFPFCVTSVRATSTMVLSQLPYQKLCLQFRNLLFAFCTETRIVFADVRQNVRFVITSAKSVILYDI